MANLYYTYSLLLLLGPKEKAALIKNFNEDTTHLKETKATLEEEKIKKRQHLQEEKHLMSRLMKQKGKEVKTDTVSEKDEEIESLKKAKPEGIDSLSKWFI